MVWRVLLLFFTAAGVVSQSPATCASSARAAQCPPSIKDETTPWSPAAPSGLVRYASIVGNATWPWLNRTRDLTDNWYKISLHNVLLAACLHRPSDLARCVPSTSYLADVDATGACVRAFDVDNCHDQGLCERIASCKWAAVEPNATTARRVRFSPDQAQAALDWIAAGYPRSLAPFMLLGLVFAGLVWLCAAVFATLRFTCDRCYGKQPRPRGYSRAQRWQPIAAMVVSTAALLFLMVLVLLLTPTFLLGVQHTVATLNATTTSLLQIQANMGDTFVAFRRNMQLNLSSAFAPPSTSLRDSYAIVASAATAFQTKYTQAGAFPFYACGGANPRPLASSLPCMACPDAVCGQVSSAVQSILTPAATALDQVLGLPGRLQAAAAVDPTDLASTAAFMQELYAAGQALLTYNLLADGLLHFRTWGLVGVIGVFLLAMAASISGFVGVFHGLRSHTSVYINLLHLSWVLGLSFASLAFAASAALLTASVVGHDLCLYMQLVQDEPELYVPDRIAVFVRGCFQATQTPLASVGLDNATAAACALQVVLQTADATVNASLGQTAAAVAGYASQLAVNAAQLWADPTFGPFLVTQATASTGQPWNTSTLDAPWIGYGLSNQTTCATMAAPLCFMSTQCKGNRTKCYQAFETAFAYYTATKEMATLAATMQADFSGNRGVQTLLTSLQDSITIQAGQNTDAVRQGIVGDIIDQAQTLQCTPSLNCQFLTQGVAKLEAYFCRDTLHFTVLASAALVLAGGFYLSLALAAILLQKRLRGVVKSKVGLHRQNAARIVGFGSGPPALHTN
ncbi:Aste57867_17301 [Aphanomyces stellatus]|uniref:Aste57867_17301 protein n=1 Tax=Aphanomyces stellatus TaxID=120398 RepID=A0A485LB28_9STRA|nr:hypothetical protein As57867_017242 [Aphanomyces stellatus]KAF0713647.1 hypothetical protein As57867_004258 [Aphanomyces stellatus]VFT81384.1 Aste57867_4269 [Aphanomyces stellatus]VFT94057.1 Aste57867_17301 [Aphanomyces stellatus]